MIKHDQVDSVIEIVVSGTGDVTQVCGLPYILDINYDTVSQIPMENFVGDSKQPIGMHPTACVLKLELPRRNN